MSNRAILAAIFLKWLLIKKRLVMLLPLPGKTKAAILNNLKLKQITQKSKLQKTAAIELFGRYAQGILFNTENGYLINSFDDVQVNRYLGNSGSYNFSEVNILLKLINTGSSVYVIGTHIGALLVPLAKKAGKVVGFEANPLTYSLLNLNISLNKLPNTVAYNYAIFDKKGSLSFYQNKANSGGSKIKPVVEDYRYSYDKPDVITVEGDTLDNLQEQNNLPFPQMIVMDIEGAEYFALKGAEKCLQHTQVLYIEFVPHHLKNVANVNLEDFCSLLTQHFSAMKLIGEEIKGANIVYRGTEIAYRLAELNKTETSADLLLFKHY